MDVRGETPTAGALDAVNTGVTAADEVATDDAKQKAEAAERAQVEAFIKEYTQARDFDKAARAQYALDRRYAAGTAHLDWAVSANLIGSFIDILVSFLYSRNPDVSVKKAPRVDNRGTKQEDDFAKTMELMISSLWKNPTSTLKDSCKKMVRSALTNGIGWLKVIVVANDANIPAMQTQLNDSRENIATLESYKRQIMSEDPLYDGPYKSQEEIDAKLLELRHLEESLTTRMEVALRKALVVDFVSAEDMQVSLDVRDIMDYKSAGWNSNCIYRQKQDVLAMFSRLTEADLKDATCYYQRPVKDLKPLNDYQKLTGMVGIEGNAEYASEADQFTSEKGANATATPDQQGPEFYKIIERWNRTTGFIETVVEGVKKWAREAYQPPYPTSRFYPYFALAFYPVDGARHPQSLPWRLFKLMNEYNAARSSKRLTRDRAIPATIFNASGLAPTEAQKIEKAVHQEFIGINPTDKSMKIGDLFAEKPIAVGDMRLFDTQDILQDMERISGVQEALQSAVSVEKTATEAEIQQTGFTSRTTADRDSLEGVLTDLAVYTGESALTALDRKEAIRRCGTKAFWPHGMAIDDLLTMVEIQIVAGTTGKPKASADRDAWATVLPLLQGLMEKIQLASASGNLPLSQAYSELIRETLVRLGDDTDPDRFIPIVPATPVLPGAAPGGMPGAPTPSGDAGMPGAAPTDNVPIGDLVAPQLAPPEVQPPA